MKTLITVLMAVSLFVAIPVMAADMGSKEMSAGMSSKESTMDTTRQCALEAETIQQKIQRLMVEVNKGQTKYKKAELEKIQQMLKDANDLLDNLSRN